MNSTSQGPININSDDSRTAVCECYIHNGVMLGKPDVF